MSVFFSGLSSLTIAIPTLLIGLHLMFDARKSIGTRRTAALFGSLAGFCHFVAYGTWAVRSLAIDPMAGVAIVMPWTLTHGVFVAIGGFFLPFWTITATHPEFFVKHKWVAILPIITTLLMVAVTIIGSLQATETVVMNFVTDLGVNMTTSIGSLFGLLALINTFFFLCLTPPLVFFLFYRRNRGTTAGRNSLIIALGFLFNAFAFFGTFFVRTAPGVSYEGIILNFVLATTWLVIYYFYCIAGGIWKTD